VTLPAAWIQQTVTAALRGDAILASLFEANRVRLYDVPPENAPEPYFVVGDDSFSPIEAADLDLWEITATVDVWSLTNPPGKIEAKTLGGRAIEILLGLASPEGAVRAARLALADFLTDPNSGACHGVIRIAFSFEAP
jgi:hypothetical protein